MKQAFTIFTVAVFLGIGVFGVFAMGHASEHVLGCLASATQQVPCPSTDPLAGAAFHVGVFKSFSKAVVSGVPAIAVIIILALAGLAIALFGSGASFAAQPAGRSHAGWMRATRAAPFPLILALTAYIARHENSPALA